MASAKTPTATVLSDMSAVPIAMLALALVMIVLAGFALRAGRRALEAQANTDGLTGLRNRRKLLSDLERAVRSARAERRSC